MTNRSTDHGHNFDQILESAVVASWASLMRGTESGSIRIEYDITPTGALDFSEGVILPQRLDRAGLLQIATPTKKEITAAAVAVNEALGRINSVSPEPALG
jgi:hypothetical protein